MLEIRRPMFAVHAKSSRVHFQGRSLIPQFGPLWFTTDIYSFVELQHKSAALHYSLQPCHFLLSFFKHHF